MNDLLKGGARVVSLDPGGVIMQKLGEEEDNVQLTLSGFSLKVVLDNG